MQARNKWNPKVASNVKPLREYFGSCRAVTVTSDDIGEYIEQLRAEGYSDGTINRRTQLLAQSFKLARRTKKLTAAPYIPHLSEVGSERQVFFETEHSEAVIQRLPEYLQDFPLWVSHRLAQERAPISSLGRCYRRGHLFEGDKLQNSQACNGSA